MYEAFFGLHERPFELTPNPRFLYLSSRQREALGNLQYGLTTPRGLTVLLGEAGTGKTTLLHAAIAGLMDASIRCVVLSNPTLTRTEFYEFLAEEFGLGEVAGRSKTRFLFELRRELIQRSAAGTLTAVILDEAQSLPYELLEEVRLLSNVETPTRKLLNVVLAGQPELGERLNEPGLRQLKQRISLRCELPVLDLAETASYIAGRLRIAGGNPASIFSREAITGIFAASGGIPRTINVVCDNALLNAFADQIRPVSRAIIEEVTQDFDLARASEPAPLRQPSDATASPETGGEAGPDSGGSPSETHGPAAMFGMFNRRRRLSFF